MVDLLSTLFTPFFGWDIVGTYSSAWRIIDFVLYLAFFVAIAKYALSMKFKGREGRMLSIIIGISFAIAMSFFGMMYGFRISDLSPLAGLVFLGLLAVVFFNFLRDMGSKTPGAGAWAFLLIYFSMIAIVPAFWQWIINAAPFIDALFAIAVLIAVFIAIRDMIRIFVPPTDTPFPGMTDSAEHLQKKAQDEAKRQVAADKANADAVKAAADAKQAASAVASAGSDDEKREATTDAIAKETEAKKTATDAAVKEKEVEKAGDDTKKAQDIKNIDDVLKKFFKEMKDVATIEMMGLEQVRQTITAAKKQMKAMVDHFEKENKEWDKNTLDDATKQQYTAGMVRLIDTISIAVSNLHTLKEREIKGQGFVENILNDARFKKSPYFKVFLKKGKVVNDKVDLLLLMEKLLHALIADTEEFEDYSVLIKDVENIRKVVVKLMSLNKKEIT